MIVCDGLYSGLNAFSMHARSFSVCMVDTLAIMSIARDLNPPRPN